jgi:hypothetical protein
MAEEIIVEVFPCTYDEDLGGEWTVPAGSRVVLALGWGAKNQGLVKQFLQAQTTTISLNGAAPVDLSDSYSAIEPRPDEEDFVSGVRHDTGVTLSAGESLQVDGMVVVSHVVASGLLDEFTHRPVLFRPEGPLTIRCRITASA